jgi:hypothetical protein
VALLGVGTPVLAAGLLFAVPALAWTGGVAAASGLGCHLASFAGAVRHRRRPLELLHGFLFASAGFLVAAIVLGAAAGIADVDPADRSRLVAGEVAALVAWLGLAVVGHAHKIVPFISYTALRSRGVTTGLTGQPLLFGDLFHHGVARATLATATAGFAAAVMGVLAASPAVLAGGGVLVSCTGGLATVNLAVGPRRAARAHRTATSAVPAGADRIPSGSAT